MDSVSFLRWEQLSRDVINIKKVYIDVAGDLVAGIVLNQIIKWHLPPYAKESHIRTDKTGKQWLPVIADLWWESCRLSKTAVADGIATLESKEIVKVRILDYKYNEEKTPTTHVQINWDILQYLLEEPSGDLEEIEEVIPDYQPSTKADLESLLNEAMEGSPYKDRKNTLETILRKTNPKAKEDTMSSIGDFVLPPHLEAGVKARTLRNSTK